MNTTLLFVLALAQPVDGEPCADTFDQTAQCESLRDTALEGGAEELGARDDADNMPVVDASTLGWQLLAISASVSTLAIGFHVAQAFYSFHIESTRDAGKLASEDLQQLSTINLAVGVLATGTWISAILLAGSGVAFLVFEPKDGSVAIPFLATE